MGANISISVGTVIDKNLSYIDYKRESWYNVKPKIGDIIFYGGKIHLVRNKGKMMNTLIIGSADPNEIEIIVHANLHDMIFVCSATSLMYQDQPIITDYITWRAVFGNHTMIKFMEVLHDENRILNTIKNDHILNRYFNNIGLLSDTNIRMKFSKMCYMQAARDIIAKIPFDILRT